MSAPSAGEPAARAVLTPATTGIENEAALAERQQKAPDTREREAAARPHDLSDRNKEGQSARAELTTLIHEMMKDGKGWPVLRLAGAIIIVLIANMIGQVRLNQWNGAFFDAVEKRDVSAFLWQLVIFLVIVGILLVLVVSQTWLQERFKIRVRERLTHVLLDHWLKPNRAYQLGFVGQAGAQPDQRLQEDCRVFSEFTAELGVGMLQATLLLVSFIGVLWTLSSNVRFELWGWPVVIPGYMVWVAIGYAGLGSGLTWLVGRPLIRLNTARYAREAELRFSVLRVNESAESVALYAGESDERRNLNRFVDQVLSATRRLSGALARLTWITSGYGWVALVVPILAAAPGYFSGSLSFGDMMMVVGAFSQVQTALRYFVDNFPKIADWRSALLRIATFRQATVDLDEAMREHRQIEVRPHPEGWLNFKDLSIALSDGSVIIDEATAEIRPGERVLIRGESGSGKSTLFRAIAGLWPWGSGVIEIPPSDQIMFLPQRPYLPLGTLRASVSYPAAPGTFDDETVRAALERCGLREFKDALDREERWDKSLSLGQQQRVAFARVLLHRPHWIFMDEATSALDEDNQALMLRLFEEELKGATILSIGHRPGLEEFHTRVLSIRKTEGGAFVLARPRPPPQPWPRAVWSSNLRRWLRRGSEEHPGEDLPRDPEQP
jgi:vitamin B12/bleomycin/antimicrobial peptide transport system ATP-binding/permease protein